jgi:tRNA(Met) cytidine acetyltransferase
VETLDRAALAGDERLLREVFGLLVHAHYRTTPGDLQRLLDAPDLSLHAALAGPSVVGVCLTGREGGLPREECEALAAGRRRIRGHALADTLITHAGCPEAGELKLARSVRLAVHPERRREGIAGRLAAHAHAAHPEAELFGTVFGATPAVVRMRRAQGYSLVRVGSARGARSGEVSVVMARPVSPRARALVARLGSELARDLPVLLELLAADGDGPDPELTAALGQGLPPPAALDEGEARRIAEGWVRGPRPFEAAAPALRFLVGRGALRPDALPPADRRLLEGRILGGRPWTELAEELGGWSVPATLRRLKAACVAAGLG